MASLNRWLGIPPSPTPHPPENRLHLRPQQLGPHIGVVTPVCGPDEAQITIEGERYIRRCAIARSAQDKRRKKTSVAWFYGEDIVRESSQETSLYYCYLCEEVSNQQVLQQMSNGTDPALTHLHEKHQINKSTGVKMRPTASTPESSEISHSFRRGLAVLSNTIDRFKELLIRWIVYCHIAFFQLENVYFRELLFFCWPGLERYLPRAANTIRRWVLDAWKEKKKEICKEMKRAHSRIHISFDLWTSSNNKAIVGVVAHYITEGGERRTLAIGLREVIGEHSAENIGQQLLQLFAEYGITHSIGFFIADNAEVNDKCIAYVLKKINPRIKKRQIARRRIRCLGHIINLCAQAFIIGKDAEKVCKDLDNAYREGNWKSIGELWRKRGAIGLLHNVIRYIRATPQRRNRFAAIQVGGELAEFDKLQLIQSNQTRWNSWYTSIGRALNIRDRINKFCLLEKPPRQGNSIDADVLSPHHWIQLEHLHDCLEAFYVATADTEGTKTALNDHFPTLSFLLDKINGSTNNFIILAAEAHKKEEKEVFTWLAGCSEQAWEKCEKYYKKADESAAYYAAILLNPELKYRWFEQQWENNDEAQRSDWLGSVKQSIEELWNDEYRGKSRTESTLFRSQQPQDVHQSTLRALYEEKANYKRIRLSPAPSTETSPPPRADQLYEYCQTNLHRPTEGEEFQPISYWQQRYDSMRDLARFALDMLAIPPMADACERLFSSAKLLLTDQRSRLKMEIIEANECLRSFYGPPRAGCFDNEAIGISEYEAGASTREVVQYEDEMEGEIRAAGDGDGEVVEVNNNVGSDIEDVVYSDSDLEFD